MPPELLWPQSSFAGLVFHALCYITKKIAFHSVKRWLTESCAVALPTQVALALPAAAASALQLSHRWPGVGLRLQQCLQAMREAVQTAAAPCAEPSTAEQPFPKSTLTVASFNQTRLMRCHIIFLGALCALHAYLLLCEAACLILCGCDTCSTTIHTHTCAQAHAHVCCAQPESLL